GAEAVDVEIPEIDRVDGRLLDVRIDVADLPRRGDGARDAAGAAVGALRERRAGAEKREERKGNGFHRALPDRTKLRTSSSVANAPLGAAAAATGRTARAGVPS